MQLKFNSYMCLPYYFDITNRPTRQCHPLHIIINNPIEPHQHTKAAFSHKLLEIGTFYQHN